MESMFRNLFTSVALVSLSILPTKLFAAACKQKPTTVILRSEGLSDFEAPTKKPTYLSDYSFKLFSRKLSLPRYQLGKGERILEVSFDSDSSYMQILTNQSYYRSFVNRNGIAESAVRVGLPWMKKARFMLDPKRPFLIAIEGNSSLYQATAFYLFPRRGDRENDVPEFRSYDIVATAKIRGISEISGAEIHIVGSSFAAPANRQLIVTGEVGEQSVKRYLNLEVDRLQEYLRPEPSNIDSGTFPHGFD